MGPRVSVSLVVYNGEKYIRDCLLAVRAQTYRAMEVVVFDNNSTDRTRDIVRAEFPEFRLVTNDRNWGLGPGWNKCLTLTTGAYFVGLCADVVIHPDFVHNGVAVMERDTGIGALQAKIYSVQEGIRTNIIDTTGFIIFKSRRIVNRGHGEKDVGQYDQEGEVFSYEGAVPLWRRTAMEESAVNGECHDEDFFWYADDIDFGWRMRLFGWKSWYAPNVIAYHDRSTTKRLSTGYRDFIRQRKTIPARKRMLDWQNIHLTFLKNDFAVSILKHLPYILKRELALLAYIIVFEPGTLRAVVRILRLLPRMILKRRIIMRTKKASRSDMERWFQ